MGSLAGLNLPQEDIWTELYIPFYDRLERSEHFETFCYYVLQSANANADQWVLNNTDKVEAFFNWLNEE